MKLARAIRTGGLPVGSDGMRHDAAFEYAGLDAPEYVPYGAVASGSKDWMFDTDLSRWPASFGCWAKPCPEWTEVLNMQDEDWTVAGKYPDMYTIDRFEQAAKALAQAAKHAKAGRAFILKGPNQECVDMPGANGDRVPHAVLEK